MTASTDAASTAAARVRAEPDMIPDSFFRGAFATLIVGGLLFLGIFAAVAYHGSMAQVSDTIQVEQGEHSE